MGLADDVRIAGKGQPVFAVSGVHQIHRFHSVAGDHKAVLLQVLHTGSKGVVVAVGIVFPQCRDHTKPLSGLVVLDPAAVPVLAAQPVRKSLWQVLLDGRWRSLGNAIALLVAFGIRLAPPQKLPLSLRYRMLTAHGIHPGEELVRIGLFREVQQVHPVLNGLVDQPVRFKSLIAVVQHIAAGFGIVGAVGVAAVDFQHHLVHDIPCGAVVFAHAVGIPVTIVHHKIPQCSRYRAQLKAFHGHLAALLIVGIYEVLQELFQVAFVVERGDSRVVEVGQRTLTVHHPAVVPICLMAQHTSPPDLVSVLLHGDAGGHFLQSFVVRMISGHRKNKTAALADLTGQLGRQHQCAAVAGLIEQQLGILVAKRIGTDLIHISCPFLPEQPGAPAVRPWREPTPPPACRRPV